MTISGSKDQVRVLISCGVIEPLCALLSVTDSQVVHVALDGLNNILKSLSPDFQLIADEIERCGGLDKIELLQTHENEDVYTLAYEIIDNYFSDETQDDANLVPRANDTGFEFSGGPPPSNQGFQF